MTKAFNYTPLELLGWAQFEFEIAGDGCTGH
jgi:hypothetical protein